MAPHELIRAQALLNLRNVDLAATIGMHEQSVCEWRNGHIAVPPYVALIVQMLLDLPVDKREQYLKRAHRTAPKDRNRNADLQRRIRNYGKQQTQA